MPDRVIKILEWPRPIGWDGFDGQGSFSDRRALRKHVSTELKGKLLARIAARDGVLVTNDLPGTLQAIVAAPPETWACLLDPVTGDPELRSLKLHANEYATLP